MTGRDKAFSKSMLAGSAVAVCVASGWGWCLEKSGAWMAIFFAAESLLQRTGLPKDLHIAASLAPCFLATALPAFWTSLACIQRMGPAERRLHWARQTFLAVLASAICAGQMAVLLAMIWAGLVLGANPLNLSVVVWVFGWCGFWSWRATVSRTGPGGAF